MNKERSYLSCVSSQPVEPESDDIDDITDCLRVGIINEKTENI